MTSKDCWLAWELTRQMWGYQSATEVIPETSLDYPFFELSISAILSTKPVLLKSFLYSFTVLLARIRSPYLMKRNGIGMSRHAMKPRSELPQPYPSTAYIF